MAFLFHTNSYPSNGKRLTGFPRYTEVLERNFKKFLCANLLTLAAFLPFGTGVLLAILCSSVLVLIPSCLIGGILAGAAVSCMHDAVMRGLRDVSGNWWDNYKRAWKQNWRQSLLPGILFCFILGFYIFMAMLFWWSERFPGWGTLALYMFGLLLFSMFFSICWPQIALFEQPFRQCTRNCLLFMIRFFPKTAGIALLQIFYWVLLVLLLPVSVFLLPLTGFWFILYTADFLIYNVLNDSFQIEERIGNAFPEQIPFYEDDEAWLKRKQEETNADYTNH